MHKLLQRQLDRYLEIAASGEIPEPLRRFVDAVEEAYQAADADRALLERSLDVASKELLQRNRELARSNGELQQFAYVVSHDLQEPLRSIAGYTQLLARRYKGKLGQDADEFIDGALSGTKRMQQLIIDLLDYSRVGSKGRKGERTTCDAALDEAIANLKTAIEESKAAITRADLPTLTTDSSQLVQVLQNLLGNAIKFRSDSKPEIHVSAERKDEEWIISVRDNGIGIPPDQSQRIFLLFQRLHERGKYPGTGIGLAICEKIVRGHGGRIWVESEPGRGSVFSFTIPDSE